MAPQAPVCAELPCERRRGTMLGREEPRSLADSINTYRTFLKALQRLGQTGLNKSSSPSHGPLKRRVMLTHTLIIFLCYTASLKLGLELFFFGNSFLS